MKSQYEIFQSILRGSKRYTFEDSILIIEGYYTGEEIRLDLSQITEETLEEIAVGYFPNPIDENEEE